MFGMRSAAIAVLGLAGYSYAGLIRMGCSQLNVQRIDPLVTPGQAPSPHMHQLIGGVGHFWNLEDKLPREC